MPLEFSHVTAVGALVPLADAKMQLRITDSDHDAEITMIRDAAQDAILAYLKAGADPAWTDQTAPLPVKHAIRVLLTHYYEHRGDDMSPSGSGETPDEDVWLSIGRLLWAYRDPTLA